MSDRRPILLYWLSLALLLGLCGWSGLAEAGREIALEVRPGYSHSAAVTLFKRNLRLQGWRVTGGSKASWRIRLCSASLGVVCMGHGKRWQSFKTPRKPLSPSTRARLLLLYFNMMRQQGQKTGPTVGGCLCGQRRTAQKPVRRKAVPKPLGTPQPRRRVEPVPVPEPRKHTSIQSIPVIQAQSVAQKSAKTSRRRLKGRNVAMSDDNDDARDFSDLVGERALPKRRVRSWSFWGGIGASADLHLLDGVNAMPGGTVHLHMGWGSFGVFSSLHFHAFFVSVDKEERSIMLFRPTFGFDWTFLSKLPLGRTRLALALQLGVTTEHRILPKATASNGVYDHHLQVGPMVGLQLLWQLGQHWAIFWRSELAVTFKPGLLMDPFDPNDMGISWRNSLGVQYRSNFF